MTQSSSIKEKIHQFIASIDDKRADAIYMLLEDEFDIEVKRKF